MEQSFIVIMYPFKERFQLAPKMIKQLTKVMRILERVQEGQEDIDRILLAEYEIEKKTYIEMDHRFQELTELAKKNGRSDQGYAPFSDAGVKSKHSVE